MTQRVVVIGAGLGGLAAAIALRRQGFDVHIYEKARDLKPVGAGLTLSPNGLKALEAIDPAIVATLRELGRPTDCVNLRKTTSDLITKIRIDAQAKYHQPMLNIRWSSLQSALAGFLPPDTIHLGRKLTGYARHGDTIEATFDDGNTVTADLLIGADGINSKVRDILVNDGRPRYAGRMSWRGVIPFRHESLLPNEVTFFAGSEGKNFAIFDVGDGYIFWSAGALSADPSASNSDAAAKTRLADLYADWAPLVGAIVDATDAAAIVERPIEDRVPLTQWSGGAVTLLGDAAHAMVPSLGQGANSAFEDAWELSRSLATRPGIEAALEQYQSSRIPRSHIIHARSARQGSRYYDADSEIFSRGILERANAEQTEFEDWLYGYTPSAIA